MGQILQKYLSLRLGYRSSNSIISYRPGTCEVIGGRKTGPSSAQVFRAGSQYYWTCISCFSCCCCCTLDYELVPSAVRGGFLMFLKLIDFSHAVGSKYLRYQSTCMYQQHPAFRYHQYNGEAHVSYQFELLL